LEDPDVGIQRNSSTSEITQKRLAALDQGDRFGCPLDALSGLLPGGTLALGVAGPEGSQYDHVQVGGNANLNGTLSIASLNNFRPVNGNYFVVLSTPSSQEGPPTSRAAPPQQ
jgi:hypothetical protein